MHMTNTLAALSAKPTFLENTSFIIVGFLFVIIVLSALSLVTALIGAVFKRAVVEQPIVKPKAAVAVSAPPPSEDTIPEHIVALITAAAHVALKGRPNKIVNIRGASQHWAQEGRREIFSSHRVR